MLDVSKIDNIDTILNPDAGRTSSKASKALSNNLGDFLKLLTTQLKNQDPTQPMDTSQFTQQIATLSGVEQQINTNRNLEDIVSLFSSSQINGVVGYIGKRIEAQGNKATLENGGAIFIYDLETEAKTVDLSITDASGAVVFSGEGDIKAGRNEVFWDGKNSFSGATMPDGVYTIGLKAKDYTGKEIKATTTTTGRITAVDLQDGKPTLLMGDHRIPLDKVLTIREDPLMGPQG